MRKMLTALAAGLLAGVTAAPALAFTPGGLFYLNGPVTVARGGLALGCTAKFTVSAPPAGAPDGDIVAVDFSGGTIGLCAALTGLGLPWHIHYVGSNVVQITGVTLTHPNLGNCGPAVLNGAWNNTSLGSLTVSAGLLINCNTSWNLFSASPQTLP